jgi:hypothetical protein
MVLSHRSVRVALLTVALVLALLAIPTGSVSTTSQGTPAAKEATANANPTVLSTSSITSPGKTDPIGVAGFQLQPQPSKASAINTTQSSPFDAANRPFKFYKDPGNSLWINVGLANPLAVSGTVTNPLGNVSQIGDITNVNGVVTLKFSLDVGAPSGAYLLYISVTKGLSTSTTQVTITESGQESASLPGVVP